MAWGAGPSLPGQWPCFLAWRLQSAITTSSDPALLVTDRASLRSQQPMAISSADPVSLVT